MDPVKVLAAPHSSFQSSPVPVPTSRAITGTRAQFIRLANPTALQQFFSTFYRTLSLTQSTQAALRQYQSNERAVRQFVSQLMPEREIDVIGQTAFLGGVISVQMDARRLIELTRLPEVAGVLRTGISVRGGIAPIPPSQPVVTPANQ